MLIFGVFYRVILATTGIITPPWYSVYKHLIWSWEWFSFSCKLRKVTHFCLNHPHRRKSNLSSVLKFLSCRALHSDVFYVVVVVYLQGPLLVFGNGNCLYGIYSRSKISGFNASMTPLSLLKWHFLNLPHTYFEIPIYKIWLQTPAYNLTKFGSIYKINCTIPIRSRWMGLHNG